MRRKRITSLLAPGLACLLVGAASHSATGQKTQATPSVLAGTVFRDNGFALAGAEVRITEAGEEKKKKKTWTSTTDSRGEFALRVPPSPVDGYNVSVKANGFEPQAKPVKLQEGERVELNFILSASN
jgi:hypothetical protein